MIKNNADKLARWFFRYLGTNKRPNLAHNWLFWPNIGILGPFGPIADPKNDANKVPRWFFRYMGNKTFSSSRKNQFFFGPKRPNLVQNMHFGHFRPNIGIFCLFRLMPDQKTMRTRCLGGFSVMWVPKLLLSPENQDCLPQNDQIWPEIGNFGPGLARLVPCFWVGCRLWHAGCISQDTFLLYMLLIWKSITTPAIRV